MVDLRHWSIKECKWVADELYHLFAYFVWNSNETYFLSSFFFRGWQIVISFSCKILFWKVLISNVLPTQIFQLLYGILWGNTSVVLFKSKIQQLKEKCLSYNYIIELIDKWTMVKPSTWDIIFSSFFFNKDHGDMVTILLKVYHFC